jgi:peptidyl-prolyl cis-trans isomerase D
MALINTLRNKMGKVVVGMVAFAILSFILADLLGPNSLFTGADNNVGEIAGESISYVEYQSQVEQFAANYSANFGRNPSEREMVTIRNQAWEMLIIERAFENEYNDLGLIVTEDELVDLVQGKNISPDIISAPIFANQQTGQFDRQLLVDFLASFDGQPAQLQSQWYASAPISVVCLREQP